MAITIDNARENIFGTILGTCNSPEDLPRWLRFCSELVDIGVPYNKIPAIVEAIKNA